ncbi:MAG TPA: isochorismatase family cysteine hydrolase [Devosiaceae bacterium]
MAIGRHPQWADLNLQDLLQNSALVVVDATNGVLHPDGAQSADGLWQRARSRGGALEAIASLVGLARKRAMPVAWLRYEYLRQHYPATILDRAQQDYWYGNRTWTGGQKVWEGALVDELAVLRTSEDLDAVYTSFGNVFLGSPLLPSLAAWNVRTILICGFHLDHCVEQAARTARDFSLVPVVVGDASAASDPADEQPTLKRIDANWAPVIEARELLTS